MMFREDVDDAVAGIVDAADAHFGARDLGWQALGPTIAVVILSTSIVGLRWYVRARLLCCLGWDDYVILVSSILSWVMLALIAAAVHQGVGVVHESALQAATVTKLIIANNNIWAILVNVTKASILMQYLRIFTDRTTRILCYALLAGLLPATLWAVLGGTLLCSPVAKLWNPQLPGHCLSAHWYWLSVAIIDIDMDFFVLCLPIPAVFGLHLPRKQKISLVAVFSLGFFVCGAGIARLTSVSVFSAREEFTISGVLAIIWSVVEANVGIICASLLALRPLLDAWFPGVFQDDRPSKHSTRLPPMQNLLPAQSSETVATLVKQPETPTSARSGWPSIHKSSLPTITLSPAPISMLSPATNRAPLLPNESMKLYVPPRTGRGTPITEKGSRHVVQQYPPRTFSHPLIMPQDLPSTAPTASTPPKPQTAPTKPFDSFHHPSSQLSKDSDTSGPTPPPRPETPPPEPWRPNKSPFNPPVLRSAFPAVVEGRGVPDSPLEETSSWLFNDGFVPEDGML